MRTTFEILGIHRKLDTKTFENVESGKIDPTAMVKLYQVAGSEVFAHPGRTP